MSRRHRYVEFQIERRMLRVGTHAYPLAHVLRVRTLTYRVSYRRVLVHYGRQVWAWIGLGLVTVLVMACMGDALPPVLYVVPAMVIVGMVATHTVRLVRRLTRPRLHVLSVDTAGPSATLASNDSKLIHDLGRRVVDAIDNPSAEFAIQVENVIFGDKVDGDKITGDKVEGHKLVAESSMR